VPLSVDCETDFFVLLTALNNSCRKRLGATTLNAHQYYFAFGDRENFLKKVFPITLSKTFKKVFGLI
jgi:hypothetical protein